MSTKIELVIEDEQRGLFQAGITLAAIPDNEGLERIIKSLKKKIDEELRSDGWGNEWKPEWTKEWRNR